MIRRARRANTVLDEDSRRIDRRVAEAVVIGDIRVRPSEAVGRLANERPVAPPEDVAKTIVTDRGQAVGCATPERSALAVNICLVVRRAERAVVGVELGVVE